MIEWWQALALSAIGGGIAYVIARAQHTWTTGATREAEQRTETRALETEEREARRQHRRTQVQPILDFVVTLRDFAGRDQVDQISSSLDKHVDVVKQVLASHGQPEDMAGELMKQLKTEWVGEEGGAKDMLFGAFRSLFSVLPTCPNEEIWDAVVWAFAEGTAPGGKEGAFQELDKLLEDYIVKVD